MRIVNPASGGTGLRPRGDFDAGTSDYRPGDAVSDGGITYVCTAAPSVTTVTRSDTFVRSDDPSGWGTASGGTVWSITEQSGGATAAISGDAGVLSSAGNSVFGVVHETLGGILDAGHYDLVMQWTSHLGSNNSGPYLLLDSRPLLDAYLFVQPMPDGSTHMIWHRDGQDYSDDGVWDGVSDGTVAWARLRLDGGQALGRCWLDGNAEPEDWALSLTQPTVLTDPRPGVQFAGSSGSFSVNSLVMTVTGTLAPSTDTNHWAILAAAPTGTPTLIGPMVVDFSDIPTEGSVKVLWTPQVGDVLLRLFADWRAAVDWDHGDIFVGQNVDGTVLPGSPAPYNVILFSNISGGWHIANLDTVTSNDTTDAAGAQENNDAQVFHSTDPVQIQLAQTGGTDPGAGHVELYALIARPVAP